MLSTRTNYNACDHVIRFMNIQGTVLSQMADDSYMCELNDRIYH